MDNSKNSNHPLDEELVSFIKKQTHHEKFGPETRLMHDLGITGTDAMELLIAFRDLFQVDMSNFIFSNHFGTEWQFVWPDFKDYIPITIYDLSQAKQTKEFPDLNSRPRC